MLRISVFGLMLRPHKVIKPWKDAIALCDRVNLYGFWKGVS
jgi:hypothetical protein